MSRASAFEASVGRVSMRILLTGVAIALATLSSCATSPLGRSQLRLFPEEQLAQMGSAAFENVDKETPRVDDPKLTAYVTCVADSVLAAVPGVSGQDWEVAVFDSEQQNAFALPGGKIGVYSGMTQLAKSPDQLASVIGHEVAHVVAEHSNERVSTSFATDTGLQLVSVLAAGGGSGESQTLMGLLGLGAQVGVLLPFSRTQEEEADLLGLDYMAAAGFDPKASVELWRNMEAAAKSDAPPEILSTHPATGTRIEALQARMPSALDTYRKAREQGRRPDCRR